MPHDQNPQLLHFTALEESVNTFVAKPFATGVHAPHSKASFATILELLRLYDQHSIGSIVEADRLRRTLSTRLTTTAPNLQDGGCLYTNEKIFAFTTGGSALSWDTLNTVDFTDGNGNGLLIAVPELFAGIQGTSQGSVQRFQGMLLYRFKEVSIAEYVGILAGQISG